MAINYGQARAGARTADEVCTLGLCSTAEGDAWMREGQRWSKFTKRLIEKLIKIPATEWPQGFDLLAPQLEDAAEVLRTGQPWIYSVSSLAPIVQAQQTLRDGAGAIATFLESKGVKVGSSPNDLPQQKGILEGLLPGGTGSILMLAALGVGGYLLLTRRPKRAKEST